MTRALNAKLCCIQYTVPKGILAFTSVLQHAQSASAFQTMSYRRPAARPEGQKSWCRRCCRSCCRYSHARPRSASCTAARCPLRLTPKQGSPPPSQLGNHQARARSSTCDRLWSSPATPSQVPKSKVVHHRLYSLSQYASDIAMPAPCTACTYHANCTSLFRPCFMCCRSAGPGRGNSG